MNEDISMTISQLEKKRDDFLANAKKIDSTIATLREVFEPAQMVIPQTISIVAPNMPAAGGTGRFTGMSVARAAMAYLKETGKPEKTTDISIALIKGGLPNKKTLYRAIYNALVKTNSVVRLEGSRWALKEWG